MNQDKTIQNNISLNISRIIWMLAIIAFFLILGSIGGQLTKFSNNGNNTICSKLIPFFFLGFEANIPTYFISFLNLFSAELLFFITAVEIKRKAPHILKWFILSVAFLYISIDEIVQIHEKLIKPISNLIGADNLGVFTFAWVIPGIIIVFSLAIFYLKFLLQLEKKTRFLFFTAAFLYVGGAIGMELIGGRHYGIHGAENLTYRMMQNIEESLEMAGLIVFIWGLLRYISVQYRIVRVIFS